MATDYQYQRVGALLEDQIPDYVQEFYPLFVIFVIKYFEFLENNSTSVNTSIQTLRLNRDIDTTANDLAGQFLNMYVPDLPNSFVVDRALLVKHFRDFYQRKGSLQSFSFFFKSFFNDDIDIVYPRDQLFKTSDGNWYVQNDLPVQAITGSPALVNHTTIVGQTSQASAVVNLAVQLVGSESSPNYSLVLQPDTLRGTFLSGETVVATYYGSNDLNSTTSASSTVTMLALGPVQTRTGRYLDSRGQLSNDQLLQDSYYYQQFSYVIRSRQDRSVWGDHVLRMLHPAGNIMFNEWLSDEEPNTTSSFARQETVVTTIEIPSTFTYLTAPTFTFDRTADFQTGTSSTRIANGTSFATVTYTSVGSITYNVDYDYPGEHITWALQRAQDNIIPVTEIVRGDGATFDKQSRTVNLDEQIIAWPTDVNSSLVVTRLNRTSSVATANTLLVTVSNVTLRAGVTSMLLLLTWQKNSQGNNAAGESNNAVVVQFSSTSTIVPYFGDETQRNFRRVALNRSLEYPELVFYGSSNSVTSPNVISNSPWSSWSWVTSTGRIVFKPYNWERGVTYDRCAIWFALDQVTQLNTSLTETFTTSNFSVVGLITSSQGIYVSSVANYGFSTSLTGSYYSFSSGAFVFNADTNSSRFIQTRIFNSSANINVTVSYIVGDGFNGGDIPENGEDLEVQRSFDTTSWSTVTKIWLGGSSNTWTYGTRTLDGTISTVNGNQTVTGVNTLFSTALALGDIITFATSGSASTAYTITNIVNNNVLTVTPTPVDTTSNVSVFRKLPASQQFLTTSIQVATGLPNTSVSVRLIQLSPSTTPLNNDLYVVNQFSVASQRTQDTTGILNLSVSVSSASTLNIADTDFFDVTTIGI